MHRAREPAVLPVQAPNTPHRTLRRQRERTLVAVDAVNIVALVAFLAWRLSRDHAKGLEIVG